VARVDLAILHEIVRVVQARAKVPERVRILKREFQITYLDDHRQRIEEALRRRDTDRLSMLFGQLASKVKYQLLRRVVASERQSTHARASARPRSRATQRKRARSR
jgi:GAF domain-containing protein